VRRVKEGEGSWIAERLCFGVCAASLVGVYHSVVYHWLLYCPLRQVNDLFSLNKPAASPAASSCCVDVSSTQAK
jgi:hypothetical protein